MNALHLYTYIHQMDEKELKNIALSDDEDIDKLKRYIYFESNAERIKRFEKVIKTIVGVGDFDVYTLDNVDTFLMAAKENKNIYYYEKDYEDLREKYVNYHSFLVSTDDDDNDDDIYRKFVLNILFFNSNDSNITKKHITKIMDLWINKITLRKDILYHKYIPRMFDIWFKDVAILYSHYPNHIKAILYKKFYQLFSNDKINATDIENVSFQEISKFLRAS